MRMRLAAHSGVIGNNAEFAWNYGTDGAFKVVLFEPLSNVIERKVGWMEERNLDPVEAVPLDFREQGKVLARKACRPYESIDAVFHFLSLVASGLPGPKCFSMTRS